MAEKELICNSCKTKISNVKGSVIFKCPSCLDNNIIRCLHCRQISAKYECSNCKYSGPN